MYNTINPINITYKNLPKITKKTQNGDEEVNQSINSNTQSATKESVQEYYKNREFPNGAKVAIDYTQNKINIAQILTDFRSTTSTIATPPNTMEEIEQYLTLVDTESRKEKPNKEIVLSNLKNASKIADGYISETLQKESKVVENWIDALFLQRINLKADPNDVNETYKLKIEKSEKIEKAKNDGLKAKEEKSQAEEEFTTIFQEIKNISKSDPESAFKKLNTALRLAQKTQNQDYIAAVHLERGKILDKCDYPSIACKEFAKATKCENGNIKTHAYLGLARIYDDLGEFEGAKENYHEAVAQSGEINNMAGQTIALKGLGSLYADKFDYNNMSLFNNLAIDAMEEVKNKKIIGKTYQQIADDYSYLGDEKQALKYLKTSTQAYSDLEKTKSINLELAKNYEDASKLMNSLGNEKKSKSLLLKSRLYRIS